MEDLYLIMGKEIMSDEIITNEIVSFVDVINPLRIITVIERAMLEIAWQLLRLEFKRGVVWLTVA